MAVRVRATLELALADVPAELVDALRAEFTVANPVRAKLEAMGRRNRAMAWRAAKTPAELRFWREAGGVLHLPRGAVSRVRRVAEAHGVRLTWRDEREAGGDFYARAIAHRPASREADGGALRWYQTEAIARAMDRQCGIIRAPTGSGKTTIALGLVAAVRVPTLVVVWSGALFDQWVQRLRDELGLRADEIGRYGAGHDQVRPVTVAMQQKLWRGMSRDFVARWGMVVIDEVQRAPARTFAEVVGQIPAKYRIGISADETRPDGLEAVTYDVFGPLVYEVSRDDLIADGSVRDVEIRVVPTEFRADWYRDQLARRQIPDIKRLLDEMEADDARNELVAEVMQGEVREGRQVAMVASRVAICRRVDAALAARRVGSGVAVGEDGAAAGEAIARLKSGELRALCASIQLFGTGVDVPALSRGVLATPIGSNRQLFGQVRGRLSRPGEPAVLYVLWDRHVYSANMLRRLEAWNRRVLVRVGGGWVDASEVE